METENAFSIRTFSIEKYHELALDSGAKIFTIGYSNENRPIEVLKKGSGKLKVLFIARIHGNEPATTQALLEFFRENDFDGIEAYGIFLANPDGAALYEQLWLKNPEPFWGNNFSDARLNFNKVDINRDWLDLSQNETRAIQEFIISLRPDYAVDMHEYYWGESGYPPKYPTDDADGFMVTMTDAPFFGTDGFVKNITEDSMNFLIPKLEKEFSWKIKPRHFLGTSRDSFENPSFLGIYLSLRGIPKLLIETWGVGCSTLLLEKRIEFHKKALSYLISWIEDNRKVFLLRADQPVEMEFNYIDMDLDKFNLFSGMLIKHGIKGEIVGDKFIVHTISSEKGFINTIYFLIFERTDN